MSISFLILFNDGFVANVSSRNSSLFSSTFKVLRSILLFLIPNDIDSVLIRHLIKSYDSVLLSRFSVSSLTFLMVSLMSLIYFLSCNKLTLSFHSPLPLLCSFKCDTDTCNKLWSELVQGMISEAWITYCKWHDTKK